MDTATNPNTVHNGLLFNTASGHTCPEGTPRRLLPGRRRPKALLLVGSSSPDRIAKASGLNASTAAVHMSSTQTHISKPPLTSSQQQGCAKGQYRSLTRSGMQQVGFKRLLP